MGEYDRVYLMYAFSEYRTNFILGQDPKKLQEGMPRFTSCPLANSLKDRAIYVIADPPCERSVFISFEEVRPLAELILKEKADVEGRVIYVYETVMTERLAKMCEMWAEGKRRDNFRIETFRN